VGEWQPLSSGRGGTGNDACILRAAIAAAPDARAATLAALAALPAPNRIPPAVILERSIWTTWATSHADVTQAEVLALGRAVQDQIRVCTHGIRCRWRG